MKISGGKIKYDKRPLFHKAGKFADKRGDKLTRSGPRKMLVDNVKNDKKKY